VAFWILSFTVLDDPGMEIIVPICIECANALLRHGIKRARHARASRIEYYPKERYPNEPMTRLTSILTNCMSCFIKVPTK
jgi:hypothetical protein